MHISNWEIKEQVDTVEVSADVDGFRLWYRLPRTYSVSRAGDPFLAAALLPAMKQGEKLEMDPSLPVSQKLLENVTRLQEIHHSWNPELKMIPIYAKTSPCEPFNDGTFSFFSGGVDSTYTFLKHLEEITHVVNIYGFDFYTDSISGGSSRFSVTDIKDLAQFAWKLMHPWDSVSAYLKGMLSKTTSQSLANYCASGSNPDEVEADLIKDLNKIIDGQLIWERKRFVNINLRPKTVKLLDKDLQGEDLRALNRLLLEDAYAREILGNYSGTYQTAIERNTSFVHSFGKTLIPVETNHYQFGYRYNLSRNLTQGSALASVALLLGFPCGYLPSSRSYDELTPLGSHPLTDPLWSNECVEIIHDGAEVRRIDKVRKIAECESALANLRVCFDDVNVNCGRCAKCLRTMISLRLLGASAGPFPSLPRLKEIRKSLISSESEMIYFKENINFALQAGDQELYRALGGCRRRNELRQLFVQFDRLLLGSIIKRAYRTVIRDSPGIRRCDTTPPKD